MGLFNRTLSERYSKLVKMIKSIDSHFQLTEDKVDSLRLHLPNYKGNQPMDFHIYLLEPFLYISFTTEVEGEKISCLSNYHQNIDQQDMFNMTMSRNLERVHQVLEKKYKKEEQTEEKQTVETSSSYDAAQEQQENGIPVEFAIEDLKENFDYNESFKKHALTFLILRPKSEFWYYSQKNEEKPLWIYNDKDEDKDKGLFLMEDRYVIGTFPFLWYLKKYEDKEELCWFFDFLNRHNMDLWAQEYAESTVNPSHPEELIKEMQRYVPSLKIRNNPQNIKVNLGWSWIDIQSMIRFFDYCINSLDWTVKPSEGVKSLRDCSTLCDLAYLVLKDMGYDFNHSNQNEKNNEPSIVESWKLMDFAREHGRMKVVPPQYDSLTGKMIKDSCCAFVHPTKKDKLGRPQVIFVDFEHNLGILTPQEIAAQKDELFIVKYESGIYALSASQKEYANEDLSTEFTEEDLKKAWVDEYGVEYSFDRKKLLRAPKEITDYSILDSTIIICNHAFSKSAIESLVLPESVQFIGEYCFSFCSRLKEINLPDSVTYIGKWAFVDCTSLASVVIPKNVKTICDSTFLGCQSLLELRIPDNVTDIEDNAFNGCSNLKEIILPKGLTKISSCLFADCSRLDNVIIPETVLSIGESAFDSCSTLNKINIPEGVTVIEDFTFKDCENLLEITMPNSIKLIGDEAFCGCCSLKSIILSDNLTNIGYQSFAYCSSLKSVIIPDSVSFIDDEAFFNCKVLKDIYMPHNLSKVGKSAFEGLDSLTTIYIPIGTKTEYSQLLPDNKDKLVEYAEDRVILEHDINGLSARQKETVISKDSTNDNSTIDAPSALEDNWWCDENGIPYIIDYMPNFSNRDNGESNTEDDDKGIENAWTEHSQLQPEHNENLVELSKESCTKLSDEDINNTGWIDDYGVEYSEDKKRLIHAPETLEEYSVREGTEVICDDAFSNVEFEDFDYYEITERGLHPYDFVKEVSKLRIVSFPNTVVSIGERVFDYCVKLETIYIPKGERVKFEKLLPDYADLLVETRKCDIKDAIDNNTTEQVWTDEYGVQYDREHHILLKAPKDIAKYVVAEGTKTIASAAFSNCENLMQIRLPESLIEIGHYAFANCNHLISFAIPAHVEKMGNGVFVNCSNMWAVQLPNCITEYEADTFQGCDSLRLVFVPKGGEFKYSDMLYGHDVITNEYDPQNAEETKRNELLLHAYMDETGMMYDFEGKVLISAPNTMEECTIKSGISLICDKAFKVDENDGDKRLLKRLFLPDTIELIANSAFLNNEGLEYINIPSKAHFLLEENPFAGCISLHSIKWDTQNALKEGTLIYNKERTTLLACLPWHYIDGIQRCWTLAEFMCQYGKMQIGVFTNHETGEQFKNCVFTRSDGTRTFAEINFASDDFSVKESTNMKDLYVAQMSTGSYSLYKGNIVVEPEKIVELPEGLETIAANAFFKNETLEEITLPQSLKIIGVDVFKGCKSLKTIRVPEGTLSRFEKLLPEWKDILVELYQVKKGMLTDFELPDGSIYSGECISGSFGSVTLSGQGEMVYPNGDKYKGEFKNGQPSGWGKYRFRNGNSHRGYFKRLPNGIGYLNENYSMAVGNFFEEKLNGWGIRFRNNIFKFGFWKNGELLKDLTNMTLWVRYEITNLRFEYQGNLIQIGKEYDFIRFGIPQKLLEKPTPEIPLSEIPKMPAWGFEFFKDGTVKVGLIEDHTFGDYMLCQADGSFDTGKWRNNIKVGNTSSFDLSNSHNKYEEDGLDVYKM